MEVKLKHNSTEIMNLAVRLSRRTRKTSWAWTGRMHTEWYLSYLVVSSMQLVLLLCTQTTDGIWRLLKDSCKCYFFNSSPASRDQQMALKVRPTCTRATPAIRMSSEIHWYMPSLRPSMDTENRAVVRIFSWYVTWWMESVKTQQQYYYYY